MFCGFGHKYKGTVFAVLGFLFLCNTAQAFERRVGARPMGMGDAFAAVADDVNSLNYNPAGLALTSGTSASLEYANLYPGLDDGLIQENHLAFTQALGLLGGVGVGWNNRSVYGTYHENEIIAGFGRSFPGVPLSGGVNLKLYYLGYTDPQSLKDEYFKNGSDKVQFGVDLGVLYRWSPPTETRPGIQTGLLLSNLNEPELGLSSSARQPVSFRLGNSAQFKEWDADVDVVYSDSETQVHVGAERWWRQKQWGARAGLIAGQGTAVFWTAGGSYTMELDAFKLRINYAFNYSFGGIQETAGIHRLSVDLLPRTSPAAPAQAADPAADEAIKSAKVERIRNYVGEAIGRYFEISDKLDFSKQLPLTPAQESAKNILHDAVGRLVLEQDILGFLQKLREAETALSVARPDPDERGIGK